jgi:hypothetical protein
MNASTFAAVGPGVIAPRAHSSATAAEHARVSRLGGASDACIAGAITVTILKLQGGTETKLFETDQRNLFSKYADKRCVYLSAPQLKTLSATSLLEDHPRSGSSKKIEQL